MELKIIFSDYFQIPSGTLENYGALDICLSSDLPLFIDPFLLFASEKPEYQKLHDKIVTHLVSLKNIALDKPKINRPKKISATTPESDAISKDLKKRGMSFVGSAPTHSEMLASFLISGPGIRQNLDLGEIDMRSIAPNSAEGSRSNLALGLGSLHVKPVVPIFAKDRCQNSTKVTSGRAAAGSTDGDYRQAEKAPGTTG